MRSGLLEYAEQKGGVGEGGGGGGEVSDRSCKKHCRLDEGKQTIEPAALVNCTCRKHSLSFAVPVPRTYFPPLIIFPLPKAKF